MFDMNNIFSIAQQIAKDIKTNNPDIGGDGSNLDMANIIQQVSKSVSNVVTPDVMNNLTNKPSHSNKKSHHKKSIKNNQGKMPDINFEITVSLYDIYHGKVKKVNVKVDRIRKDGAELKLVKEKNKLEIEIPPGMPDGTIIKFEGEGDQRPGYKAGDINVAIKLKEHDMFERDGDNIVYTHTCSLPECYKLDFLLDHPNGNTYNIKSNTNTFNMMNPIKIVKGFGLPVHDEEDCYGDLIVVLNFMLPQTLEDSDIELFRKILPNMQEEPNPETEIEETIVAEDPDIDEEDTDGEESDDGTDGEPDLNLLDKTIKEEED